MIIAGLQKNTLIDYPGKVACTVFLASCNFRCPFCYSTELVLPEKIKEQGKIPEKEFFNFLESHQGLLEGVVLCGGEPSLNNNLPKFADKIKKMNFSVKFDTNGSNPEMLEKLVESKMVDYVAMDIKAPKSKYDTFSGNLADIEKVEQSMNFLKKGNVDYEFRTTAAPGLSREDILKIADWISPAKRYFIQEFSNQKQVLDPSINTQLVLDKDELNDIAELIGTEFEVCGVR